MVFSFLFKLTIKYLIIRYAVKYTEIKKIGTSINPPTGIPIKNPRITVCINNGIENPLIRKKLDVTDIVSISEVAT